MLFTKRQERGDKKDSIALNVYVCSRDTLLQTLNKINGRVGVISINDPSTTPIDPYTQAVYCFFKDTEDETGMSQSDAAHIAEFVRERVSVGCRNIVVQCTQGISRSAGVAAAILRAYRQDEGKILNDPAYCINGRCYRMTCEAFGLPTSTEDAEMARLQSRAAYLSSWPAS